MEIKPYDGLTLSHNQLAVLRDMHSRYDTWGEGPVHRFKTMAKDIGIEERLVRLACRALARKKLAEHVRGLVFMQGEKEGMLAGSGYAITKEGFEVIERMNEFEEAKKVRL